MTSFNDLGLSSQLLKSIAALGYETPTPIQIQAIPVALDGEDVLGLAQTGTGKTAAFGLPLVNHLLLDREKPRPRSTRALILSPTRELVNQIADNLADFAKGAPIRVTRVVGGASIGRQARALERGVDILVATPGRLLDLVERRDVSLGDARFLVLDEADQMLDLGFIHALRRIEKLVGKPRQTLLFSATMPKNIEELARAFLTDPVKIAVSPPGTAVEKIRQSVYFVDAAAKTDLLKERLAARPDALSLVFARTKHGAERLMKNLVKAGFAAASIHGNKNQNQRERAIAGFRSGDVRVLVATDVAARGIDVPGVTCVYNFELPNVAEAYVHRIGRTARAGAEGEAVAFCAPDEQKLLRDIERLMKTPVPVAGGEPARKEPAPAPRGQRRQPQTRRPNASAERPKGKRRPARRRGAKALATAGV